MNTIQYISFLFIRPRPYILILFIRSEREYYLNTLVPRSAVKLLCPDHHRQGPSSSVAYGKNQKPASSNLSDTVQTWPRLPLSTIRSSPVAAAVTRFTVDIGDSVVDGTKEGGGGGAY